MAPRQLEAMVERAGKDGQYARQRRQRRRRTPPGAPPGRLAADPGASRPRMDAGLFGRGALAARAIAAAGALPTPGDHAVRWINVEGLGDADTVREVGAAFGLHPLALEDILDVDQRPKLEAYDDNLFIILRTPAGNRGGEEAAAANRPALE